MTSAFPFVILTKKQQGGHKHEKSDKKNYSGSGGYIVYDSC